MTSLMKGALLEYGSDFLGPLPNLVIFQFNPETLSRTVQIPNDRITSGGSAESGQAGTPPLEKITFTAFFDASDQLGDDNQLARTFGIGPQLAALEKMVYPAGELSSLIGEALDKVGEAIFGGGAGESEPPTNPIPRQKYPRILFVWGQWRVLPVIMESMSITEHRYDSNLNPIHAEVSIGLGVIPVDNCSDDIIAKGAFQYSSMAKETQAISNLAIAAGQISDLIPF